MGSFAIFHASPDHPEFISSWKKSRLAWKKATYGLFPPLERRSHEDRNFVSCLKASRMTGVSRVVMRGVVNKCCQINE